MESCMNEAIYNAITAKVTGPDSKFYTYTSEQVVEPGWKCVAGYEKVSKNYRHLQLLKNDTEVKYNRVLSKVTLKDIKMHYTEARLVQLLEKEGIGRPSTFSSLIDKIQERKYVVKENVPGKKVNCIDFELEGQDLSEIEEERVFGAEKNKLVIQPLGILVIEFLVKNFEELFNYNYTKNMENKLDSIANGKEVWQKLCKTALTEIEELSKGLIGTGKNTIKIDENHTYMIAKYGPVIKCQKGEDIEFIPVKTEIDLDKLRAGEYQLKDIISEKNGGGRNLGLYKDKSIIAKEGKFGLYIEYSGKRYSLKVEKQLDDLILEEVLSVIEDRDKTIVREIDENTSVRTGKYGDYIFHKKAKMKKPKFIKLQDFIKLHGKNSYKTCDINLLKEWLSNMYVFQIRQSHQAATYKIQRYFNE